MGKEMIFKSMDALTPVQNVIDEADKALNDTSRRIDDSPISEVLYGACGTGTGTAIGFIALYFGGVTGLSAAGITSGLATAGAIIGGGMTAGIAVLAAPAVLLTGTAVYIARKSKEKKLEEAKRLLYKNAVIKQSAIIDALRKENYADKGRIDYLTSLNNLLRAIIRNLGHDLDPESA